MQAALKPLSLKGGIGCEHSVSISRKLKLASLAQNAEEMDYSS